ncbi:MAG: hypothetical protein B0D94_11060 [Candidatus Sedimenticola endophacoides]|nr:MAG: hypothetical protein B0D94_11060 [Candidatus Sedimenticola endophacoides]
MRCLLKLPVLPLRWVLAALLIGCGHVAAAQPDPLRELEDLLRQGHGGEAYELALGLREGHEGEPRFDYR